MKEFNPGRRNFFEKVSKVAAQGVLAHPVIKTIENSWGPRKRPTQPPTPLPPEPVCEPTGREWSGIASEYSRDGCYKCSSDEIMANGEPLDDTRETVAFNRLPADPVNPSFVEVDDLRSGKSTIAEVTDHGGFEAYGRIIDLNIKTAEEVGFDFDAGLDPVKVKEVVGDCEPTQ